MKKKQLKFMSKIAEVGSFDSFQFVETSDIVFWLHKMVGESTASVFHGEWGAAKPD